MRRCNRCVMDDRSDPTIRFDKEGNCNYCSEALKRINTIEYFPNEEGEKKLAELLRRIKTENSDKNYDCIMGISGGLDSSYLAYLGYKWGLRILGVHIDDGYDTDISKRNIAHLCEAAHIDLRIIKPDQKQYDALTLAYLKAGVPDIAVPQDNILFAFLFDEVKKEKIKYFLSGGNFALESILQHGNAHDAMDVKNIKAINNRYGTDKVDKLKFITSYRKYIRMKLGTVVSIRPLNYIDYNRDRAFSELKSFCGFEYYGSKHLENKLTAFVQLYWLPIKFGVDKRTSHLSSMIVSGQMTRDEAIKELDKPICDMQMMKEYICEIEKRLGITEEEFDNIMKAPAHEHVEYSYDRIAPIIHKILS